MQANTYSIFNGKWILVAMSAFVVGVAIFATLGLNTQAATATSCLTGWQAVFQAKHTATNDGSTSFEQITTPITYKKLKALVAGGSSLKFYKSAGVGGGSGDELIECGHIVFADGDNVATCYGMPWYNGEAVTYPKISIAFPSIDDSRVVNYVADENETVGFVQLKIFASK